LKRTKSRRQKISKRYDKAATIRPRNSFFIQRLQKIQNTFYPSVYLAKNRRLFTLPLWVFCGVLEKYAGNMQKIGKYLINLA